MKKKLALVLFVLGSLSPLHAAYPNKDYPEWNNNALIYDTFDPNTLSIICFGEGGDRTPLLSLDTFPIGATTPGETFEALMKQSHQKGSSFCFILCKNKKEQISFIPTNFNLYTERELPKNWNAVRKYRLHPSGKGEFYNPTVVIPITNPPSTTFLAAPYSSAPCLPEVVYVPYPVYYPVPTSDPLTTSATPDHSSGPATTLPAQSADTTKSTVQSPDTFSARAASPASAHDPEPSIASATTLETTPHTNVAKTEGLKRFLASIMDTKASIPPAPFCAPLLAPLPNEELNARRTAALEQEKKVQEIKEAELKAAAAQEAEAREKERLRVLEAARKIHQQATLEQEKRAQEAKKAKLKAAAAQEAEAQEKERLRILEVAQKAQQQAALEQEKRAQEAKEAELKAAAAQEAEVQEKERLRVLEAARKTQQQAALEQEKRAQEAKKEKDATDAKKAKDDAKKAAVAKKAAAAAKEAALLEKAAAQATAAKAKAALVAPQKPEVEKAKTAASSEQSLPSAAAHAIVRAAWIETWIETVIERHIKTGDDRDLKEVIPHLNLGNAKHVVFLMGVYLNEKTNALLQEDQITRLMDQAFVFTKDKKIHPHHRSTLFFGCALDEKDLKRREQLLNKCVELDKDHSYIKAEALLRKIRLERHDSTPAVCKTPVTCPHIETFDYIQEMEGKEEFCLETTSLKLSLLARAISVPESCFHLKTHLKELGVEAEKCISDYYDYVIKKLASTETEFHEINKIVTGIIPPEKLHQPK